MPMPAYPLPGPPDQYLELLGQVAISRPSPQYAQPAMADPRVAQRMRLEELAARQAEIDRATPGLLKDRAQKAWDQRRRAARPELRGRRKTEGSRGRAPPRYPATPAHTEKPGVEPGTGGRA